MHRHLTESVYKWKITDRYTAGVPDTWYSGCTCDLWIEWKYLKKTPKKHTANLSALQKDWLNSRYKEGRNVAVIIGSPNGGIILRDLAWNSQAMFSEPLKPVEIAHWITVQVTKDKQPQN